MSDGTDTVGGTFPRLVAAARMTTAVILGGCFATFTWLAVMQEGHSGRILGRRWTDHDFADGLGYAVGAEETARIGFLLSLALGIGVAIVFALVNNRLPGRGWRKGLVFAIPVFLAWGLAFTPFANSRQVLVGSEFQYFETGPFASGAGVGTIASAIVASLAASIFLARIFELVRDADWWNRHEGVGVRGALPEELFELTEQGSKQRGEGTG